MGYDQGDVYFNYYPPALYYEELKNTYGEGNYAIAPYLVSMEGYAGSADVERNLDDTKLFYMDQTSYDIFDWPLESGTGFSSNPNEVIAFGDYAKVGDVIVYEIGNTPYVLKVVGVFDLDYYPMRYQRGVYATDSIAYFEQYRERNFVTGSIKNAYLLHPAAIEAGSYRYVDNVSGAYVKKEAIEAAGEDVFHKYCIPSERVGGWLNDGSATDNNRWILINVLDIVVTLLVLIIYLFFEMRSRFKKERNIYIMLNRCGMATDTVVEKIANAHIWPLLLGGVVGLVIYIFTYIRIAGHWWHFVVAAICVALYLIIKLLITRKIFDRYVKLRYHQEGKMDLASVEKDFIMDPDKTVRKNLSIPATFEATNEKGIAVLVDRMLGIGCVHAVSELKYRHLSEYEKFKARFARALMVVPDVLFIGQEYNNLTDKQRAEMDRMFEKVKNNWNVQIEFTDR